MRVVLDTTELFRDRLLSSHDMQQLIDLLSKGRGRLVVPEIVVLEAQNHVREGLEETVGGLDALNSLLTVCQRPVVDLGTINVPAAVEAYGQALRARLQEIGAHVPGHSGVTVDRLLERCLKRRRPFDPEGGRGFRDAILWSVVLSSVCDRHEKALLVTANKKDFGLPGSLHDHLADDLVAMGYPRDAIVVCGSVQQALRDSVATYLQAEQAVRDQLHNGRYRTFDLTEFLRAKHEDLQQEILARAGDWSGHGNGYFNSWDVRGAYPHVVSFLFSGTPTAVTVDDVRRVDGGLWVTVTYQIPARHSYRYEIWGPQYDPHGSGEVEEDVVVLVSLAVVLNESDGNVQNWSVWDARAVRLLQSVRSEVSGFGLRSADGGQ